MKNVVIIGAGPAGLTAGYELLKQSSNYSITVFEESANIGGISRTVHHNGNRMDIGGHRFFSKDDRVNKWWSEFMPIQGSPSYDDIILDRKVNLSDCLENNPEKIDTVMLRRSRVSRIFYKNKFFDYPVKMNASTIKNMGFSTTLNAGFSYVGSMIHKLPEDSLENFYINRFGRKLYSMFFEGYTEKLWGRHPREISADWGAQRVKGLSVIAIIKDIFSKVIPGQRKHVETSLIEEYLYPKFGPGQLWETVANQIEIKGGKIEKKAKVVEIKTENNRIISVVYEKDNKRVEYPADIVISTMPLKDLVNATNDVPSNVLNVANGLPYRDFVTVGLLLNKINLKNETKFKTLNNIVPDCWIYVQDIGVKLGRIQIFNNWSPYLVADPENTIWIGLEYFCNENDKYWNMSEKEWMEYGIKELVSMGVINSEEKVLDYHCEKVKKAYPAYFDTYSRINEVVEWADNIENLYCIGRNGQHRYNNMDHSMVTAFEAVSNIVNNRKDKSNIWSVNTEKEYHEEKNDI